MHGDGWTQSKQCAETPDTNMKFLRDAEVTGNTISYGQNEGVKGLSSPFYWLKKLISECIRFNLNTF